MSTLGMSLLDAEDEQTPYHAHARGGRRSAWSTRLQLASAFACGMALTAATFALVLRVARASEAAPLALFASTAPTSPFSQSSSAAAARQSRAAAETIRASGYATSALSLFTTRQDGAEAGNQGSNRPYKFALDSVTPVSLQLGRGTCWIFTAIAVLEASYRRQGIQRGWLRPDQYVKLSEQGFGVAVLDLCRRVNSSCGALVGTEIWTGTQLKPMDTQGGESYLLYYLLELRYIGALPHTVCLYTPTTGRDHYCPGITAARESNPLRFEVSRMSTEYEREAAKSSLLRGRVLALSTSLLAVTYVLPCTEASAFTLKCDPHNRAKCVPCPDVRAFAGYGCCVAAKRDGTTMDGDFFRLPQPTFPEAEIEGGHAMTLVGFTDTYRSLSGFQGGFILKNSWWDGLPPSTDWKQARGSHSIDYYMQEISAEEEAFACPNAHNPRRWYQCADLAECRGAPTVVKAARFAQPLHLECIDASPYLRGLCEKGQRYFLQSLETFGSGSGLSSACFIHDPDGNRTAAAAKAATDPAKADADADADAAAESDEKPPGPRRRLYGPDTVSLMRETPPTMPGVVCTPWVPLDDVALVWSPIAAEARPNNPDLCGFYFFPYSIIDEIMAKDHNFQVNDMDVVWHPESYEANSKTFPYLNYTLLKLATATQQSIRSEGPLPYTKQTPFHG